MNLMIITLLSILYLVTRTGGELTCYCSTCVTEQCMGDHCTSQAGYDPNTGMVQYTWGCLPTAGAIACNTSSTLHTYLCCNTGDDCNRNLSAQLGETEGTMSLATPDTGATVPPVLIPENGGTPGNTNPPSPESTPTPSLPFPTGSPSCFQANTEEGGAIELCPLTSSCYSTVRRTSNDEIVWKRGCSEQCVNETRNRKVKRCCHSHMCNIKLHFEDFFPTMPPSELTESSESTTVTDFTDTPSERTPILPPILTPLSSTTSAPHATDTPGLLHCHCQSDDCISDTNICSTPHACAIEYSISLGTVQSYKQVCVAEESGCGLVRPDMYRSCCNTQFCNEDPNFDDIPLNIVTPLTTQVTDSTTPTHTTPTDSTTPSHSTTVPSPTPSTNFRFTIGTIVLSVVGVLLMVVLVIIVTAVCVVRRRRTKKVQRELPTTYVPRLCRVASIDISCHSNGADDAGRVSVQSTVSSSSTPSNGKSSNISLMTSV